MANKRADLSEFGYIGYPLNVFRQLGGICNSAGLGCFNCVHEIKRSCIQVVWQRYLQLALAPVTQILTRCFIFSKRLEYNLALCEHLEKQFGSLPRRHAVDHHRPMSFQQSRVVTGSIRSRG